MEKYFSQITINNLEIKEMSIFSRKKKNKHEHDAKEAVKKATFVPVEEVDKLKKEITNLNHHIE